MAYIDEQDWGDQSDYDWEKRAIDLEKKLRYTLVDANLKSLRIEELEKQLEQQKISSENVALELGDLVQKFRDKYARLKAKYLTVKNQYLKEENTELFELLKERDYLLDSVVRAQAKPRVKPSDNAASCCNSTALTADCSFVPWDMN